MSDRRPPPKEFRAAIQRPRRTYAEKLLDPKWQKKRLEVFNAAGWRCQECRAEDQTLNVHHSFYELGKEPWTAPGVQRGRAECGRSPASLAERKSTACDRKQLTS